MPYLEFSAVSRGQTKQDDLIMYHQDTLFDAVYQDSFYFYKYFIEVYQSISDLKTRILKPVEDGNGSIIGDENRYKSIFANIGFSAQEILDIRDPLKKSIVLPRVFDLDTDNILQDKNG